MSDLTLSVVLSLVSAVAYAGGAIVQERVSLSSGTAYAPLRRPAWWGAVALNGLGAALHVGALAYGPLSLVQPLGALTIVFALPMAALLVGRKAGATAWRGALMASLGLAGLLALTGSGGARTPSGTQMLVVGFVTVGVVLCLVVAARTVHHHPAARGALVAAAAGVAFGMASVFTKTVADRFSTDEPFAQTPSLVAIAVFAASGMLLSQASYRGAGLAAPLSTATVVNPVVAAVLGLTLFGEHFRYGVPGTVLALGCGIVAAGGLILLTTERIGGGGSEELPPPVTRSGGPGGPRTDGTTPGFPSGEGPVPGRSQGPDEAPADGGGGLPRVRYAPAQTCTPPARR